MYLVECHRSGYCIYGRGPLVDLCQEHIFSKWPNHLFENLDKEYKEFTELTRGQATAVSLPPLTALILSRAPRRQDIPMIIRGMREEYEESRMELWERIEQMWSAPNAREQARIPQELQGASEHLFKAALPEKVRALTIATELSKLSPSGVAALLKR